MHANTIQDVVQYLYTFAWLKPMIYVNACVSCKFISTKVTSEGQKIIYPVLF